MRRFAARVVTYLMLRAVGTLTPSTNPSNASGWVNALLAADTGDWTTAGLAGGAYGKVIRWAFEKQGLFQAAGGPTPVAREGKPPAQDVYIDDGRHGEYQFQAVHWDNQNVWNRRYADDGTLHEDPWLNRTNYAYCRVRNRGTQTATGVVVKAYNTDPGAGLTWPDDWVPMTTTQLAVPDIPSGGEVVVGPFSWTPTFADHECLLMIASSSGDPSNVDAFGAGESIPEWRLVPHDNNIGQRNVHPVPAAAGALGIGAPRWAVLHGAQPLRPPGQGVARHRLTARVGQEGMAGPCRLGRGQQLRLGSWGSPPGSLGGYAGGRSGRCRLQSDRVPGRHGRRACRRHPHRRHDLPPGSRPRCGNAPGRHR